MELKEFISETLTQIMEGVIDAQNKVKESGALIAPSFGTSTDKCIKSGDLFIEVYEVEMNVSLTVVDKEGKKSGVGIEKYVKIGVSGESNTENSAMNSIKFKIPITFPTMPDFKDNKKRTTYTIQ